jgi:hypothetical protein
MTNDLQRLSMPILLFDSEYALYNQYEMGSELHYLIRPDGYILHTEVKQQIVKGC